MRSVVPLIFLCVPAYLSGQGTRAGEAPTPHQVVAIVGGRLVDVVKGTEADKTTVLVVDGRIRAVGREGEVVIPSEAKILDAHTKWLIPGLMDMHVHLQSIPLARLYLANGVTTVRNTGGDITALRLLSQDTQSGKVIGPRLYFAGQILDGNPPVNPAITILVDSEQRATSAVNFLADQGASFIKVYNNVSEAALIAILKAAHARGLPVTGHVPRVITTTRAIELGMDCLEHIRITGRELLPQEEADKIDFLTLGRRETLLWQRFDVNSVAMNKVVNLIAKRHVFLDPTLVVDQVTFSLTPEERASEPNNQMLPQDILERMKTNGLPESWRPPAELRDVAAAGFEKRLTFIGMCYRAGVRLIAGTDGPALGPVLPGFGLHSEMELLVKAGLPPLDALRAATSTAARALRVTKDLGTIEQGKLADLVILDADPLQNISNVRRIFRVLKDGQIYDPQELLANRAR